MKKFLVILFASLLFGGKVSSSSLPADAITLICATDDETVEFQVLIIPSTREGLNMGAHGAGIDELIVTDTYYQLSGLFVEGKSEYHLKINRGTGRYRHIWQGISNSDQMLVTVGSCEKKKKAKF